MQVTGITNEAIKSIFQINVHPLMTELFKEKPKSYLKQIGGKITLRKIIPILHENVINDSNLK